MKSSEYIGMKFSRLEITDVKPNGKNPIAYYKCDCGVIGHALLGNIRQGRTVSCGCRLKETWASKIKHNMSGTPTHNSWESMINRCKVGNVQNAKAPQYSKIKICTRWRSFENFLEDMGVRPLGTTLDRIDNTKGYSPDNCRWATKSEQQNNRSVNNTIEFCGEKKTLAMWARELGVPATTILGRLKAGLPIELAFTKGRLKRGTLSKFSSTAQERQLGVAAILKGLGV